MNDLCAGQEQFKCECTWKGRSITQLRKHIEIVHKNEGLEWFCGACDCKKPSYKLIYNHQRRHVRQGTAVSIIVKPVQKKDRTEIVAPIHEDPLPDTPEEFPENSEDIGHVEDVSNEPIKERDRVKSKLMQMALILSTKHKVNDDAMNFLFQSLGNIQDELSHAAEDKLYPFHDLRTSYRRQKILLQQAGVVKPCRVDVGIFRKKRRDGIVKDELIQAFVVPVVDTLKFVLKNHHFVDSVRSDGNRRNGVWDINVGMSIDDVELANPLGQGKIRHKQTVCSFEIGNLPTWLRSRDESKHLAFLSNSLAFKKKHRADEKLLNDFKTALEDSKDGLKLLEDSDDLFRIKLQHVTADAEAMCSLLKLKMTGAKTKKPCWGCHIHHDDLPWVLDVQSMEKRTLEDHEDKCQKVVDPTVKKSVRENLAKETGIKGAAAITQLEGFTFDKMCFDGMHCVLEGGILELGILDFLRELINEAQVITFEQANARIVHWKYRLKRGDVSPPAMPRRILVGGSLGYKAQTCWTLAENLLFVFRDYADTMKPHFKHFGRCLRISQVILHAPVTCRVNTEILRVELMHFHAVRLSLYSWANFTPKCHFSLHIPDQIRRHGPSRFTSCLQFERHYKTIKSKRLNCWKNPSKTLANFHQQWQVRALCEVKEGKWTSKNLDLVTKYVKRMDSSDLPDDVVAILEDECVGAKLFQKAEYGTKTYNIGDFLDRSNLNEWEPDFLRVECFVLQQQQCLIAVTFFKCKVFKNCSASFQCVPGEVGIVSFSDIEHKYTLPAFLIDSEWFINRKYAAAIEDFSSSDDEDVVDEMVRTRAQKSPSPAPAVKKSKIVVNLGAKPTDVTIERTNEPLSGHVSTPESQDFEIHASQGIFASQVNPVNDDVDVEDDEKLAVEEPEASDLDDIDLHERQVTLKNTCGSTQSSENEDASETDFEEDNLSQPKATAGSSSTPRRRGQLGTSRQIMGKKTKLDFEKTEIESTAVITEIPAVPISGESDTTVIGSGIQDSDEAGTPEHVSPGGSKVSKPHRRTQLAKIVISSTKEMAAKWNLTSPTGQHKFKKVEFKLPQFTPKIKAVLEDGSKKEVAALADAIAREIVKNMHARDGSGSKEYYNKLERELLLEYPTLDNSLLRNNLRREMNKNIPLSQLSEDSEEEDALKPKPGQPRRTLTNKHILLPLKNRVSLLNRAERKADKRRLLIAKGQQSWESYGFSQVLPGRRLRSEMEIPADPSATKHQKAIKHLELTPEQSEFEDPTIAESYRKTFQLRTAILQLSKRAFGDVLNIYRLFMFKKYLQVEAEVYLGSADNVSRFLANVDLAWNGIGKLPIEGNMPEALGTDEAITYKFKTLLAPLGPSVVNFTQEEHLFPGVKFAWPFIVHCDNQTIIRYEDTEWLDMNGLKEALAHLVLIINVFEFTLKSRPQLLLLLESLFFGYAAPLLSENNVILMNKIMDLGKPNE